MTKKKIIERLDVLGVYDKTYDYIIAELIWNLQLMRKAKKDIRDNGLTVCGSVKNPDYMIKNPSISTYNDALKNIMNISRKLGLTPRDMKDIVSSAENTDDGFDD